MKQFTPKQARYALECKSIIGPKSGRTYLVFRKENSYHVFAEIETKDVAREEFGALKYGTPPEFWKKIWDSFDSDTKRQPKFPDRGPSPSALKRKPASGEMGHPDRRKRRATG